MNPSDMAGGAGAAAVVPLSQSQVLMLGGRKMEHDVATSISPPLVPTKNLMSFQLQEVTNSSGFTKLRLVPAEATTESQAVLIVKPIEEPMGTTWVEEKGGPFPGLYLSNVDEASAAWRCGVQVHVGQRLTTLNDQPVHCVQDVLTMRNTGMDYNHGTQRLSLQFAMQEPLPHLVDRFDQLHPQPDVEVLPAFSPRSQEMLRDYAVHPDDVRVVKRSGEVLGCVLDMLHLIMVNPNSPAERHQLERFLGCRLTHVNGRPVTDLEDIHTITEASVVYLRWGPPGALPEAPPLAAALPPPNISSPPPHQHQHHQQHPSTPLESAQLPTPLSGTAATQRSYLDRLATQQHVPTPSSPHAGPSTRAPQPYKQVASVYSINAAGASGGAPLTAGSKSSLTPQQQPQNSYDTGHAHAGGGAVGAGAGPGMFDMDGGVAHVSPARGGGLPHASGAPSPLPPAHALLRSLSPTRSPHQPLSAGVASVVTQPPNALHSRAPPTPAAAAGASHARELASAAVAAVAAAAGDTTAKSVPSMIYPPKQPQLQGPVDAYRGMALPSGAGGSGYKSSTNSFLRQPTTGSLATTHPLTPAGAVPTANTGQVMFAPSVGAGRRVPPTGPLSVTIPGSVSGETMQITPTTGPATAAQIPAVSPVGSQVSGPLTGGGGSMLPLAQPVALSSRGGGAGSAPAPPHAVSRSGFNAHSEGPPPSGTASPMPSMVPGAVAIPMESKADGTRGAVSTFAAASPSGMRNTGSNTSAFATPSFTTFAKEAGDDADDSRMKITRSHTLPVDAVVPGGVPHAHASGSAVGDGDPQETVPPNGGHGPDSVVSGNSWSQTRSMASGPPMAVPPPSSPGATNTGAVGFGGAYSPSAPATPVHSQAAGRREPVEAFASTPAQQGDVKASAAARGGYGGAIAAASISPKRNTAAARGQHVHGEQQKALHQHQHQPPPVGSISHVPASRATGALASTPMTYTAGGLPGGGLTPIRNGGGGAMPQQYQHPPSAGSPVPLSSPAGHLTAMPPAHAAPHNTGTTAQQICDAINNVDLQGVCSFFGPGSILKHYSQPTNAVTTLRGGNIEPYFARLFNVLTRECVTAVVAQSVLDNDVTEALLLLSVNADGPGKTPVQLGSASVMMQGGRVVRYNASVNFPM